MYLQTTDCSIYEAVGEPGEAVSGGVTAVYVGSQQADSVNRIEIVTDDFMYSRGDQQRVSITRSVISREEVPGRVCVHTTAAPGSLAVRSDLHLLVERNG